MEVDKKEGPVDAMDAETKEEEKEEGEISESEDEEDKKEVPGEAHEGKGKKRSRPIENKRLIDFPRDSIVKKRLDYIIKTAMSTPISEFMIKSTSSSASSEKPVSTKQSAIDKFVKREEEKKRKRSSDEEEKGSAKKTKLELPVSCCSLI